MAASTEVVGGVVNALRRAMRRVSSTVSRRVTGRAVLALAELTFAQMGIPGAVGCCEYLVGWWGSSGNCPHRVPPLSGTSARDRERS